MQRHTDYRARTGRPQPAPPQSHYQPLSFMQGKMVTGGSNSTMNTGNDPDQQRLDSPVYHVLTEHESDSSHDEPVFVELAEMATAGGSNSTMSTGKEPDQQRPDSPVYHVLTEHEQPRKSSAGTAIDPQDCLQEPPELKKPALPKNHP